MERSNLDRFKILAAAATLAMFAGTACAETELYGWVNRAIMHTDDAFQQSTLFVDNAFNPSVLGAKGHMHLNKCVVFGGVLEGQFQPNNSRMVSQLDNTDIATNMVLVKRADTWVDGGVWGKLSLGYGDAASYGIMLMSYAKTGDTVSSAMVQNMAGGMIFHPSTGAASLVRTTTDNPSVNAVFNTPNGVGSVDSLTGRFAQKNRVRWDSDKWNGLALGVSFGSVQEMDTLLASPFDFTTRTRQYTDIALRYEGNFSDFMLSAGIAWAKYTRDGDVTPEDLNAITGTSGSLRGVQLWSGSIAAEHKCTGINLAVAYGSKRKIYSSLNNNKVWFVQLGKHFDWTSYGKTNVVLDYWGGKNALNNTDKSKSWGLGVSQDLDKANTSVYASVRGYKYSNGVNLAYAPTPYNSIWALNAGFLFKFGAML